MFKTIIFVALGGAAGSVFRFLTAVLVNKYWQSVFPMATLITNCIGCFLIGFLVSFLQKHDLFNSDLKRFLITGFCGGYTTFSAFGLENINLLENQNIGLSIFYIVGSVIIGITFVALGMLVGKG